MTLIVIYYNFKILPEKGCEVKYIPPSELRGTTVAPQMNGDVLMKMRVNLLDLVLYLILFLFNDASLYESDRLLLLRSQHYIYPMYLTRCCERNTKP